MDDQYGNGKGGYGQDGYSQNDYGQMNYGQTGYNQGSYSQNNQGSYGQTEYNQGNYGQTEYNQGNYGQTEYNQGNYGQTEYNQGNYGQTEYNQGNYGQTEYNQRNYGQTEYNQGSYGQTDYNQNNYNQTAYSQNNYGQTGYNTGNYSANGYQSGSMNNSAFGGPAPTNATEAIREIGKSFPFLFGTICFTLSAILSIASVFFNSGYPSGAQVSAFLGSLIGFIPLAVIVAGMWTFFASCASRRPVPATTGITLTRGGIITFIVLICIVLGLLAVVIGFLIFAFTVLGEDIHGFDSFFYEAGINSYYLSYGYAIVIGFFVFIVVLIVLCLIYYIKMLKTTRVIRDVLRTGNVVKNISMYHIVFNFIAIICGVIIMIVNFRMAPYIEGAMPAAIQAALTIISYISVTVALLMLRSRLKAQMVQSPQYR